MPHRDDHTSLGQMLTHAREALVLAKGKSRQDLDRERVLVLALLQLLQIVGEAASRVSPAYCTLIRKYRGPKSLLCETG
jgi:uncharacterized protein with HEPN domain